MRKDFFGIVIKHSIPVLYIAFLPSVYCCSLCARFSFVEKGNGHKEQ